MGRKLLDTTTFFPVRVRNIGIARKCNRIHLLHGARASRRNMAGNRHRPARPPLRGRFADPYSHRRRRTGAGLVGADLSDRRSTRRTAISSAPGSELAWAGANPCIKQQQPELSLRLYQSTFDNPRPDLEIASIDCVSAVTDAAPFLVGPDP